MESLAVGNERAHRKDRLAKTVLHKQPVHVWLLPRYYTNPIDSVPSPRHGFELHLPPLLAQKCIRASSPGCRHTTRCKTCLKRRQSSCSHYRSVCHCTRRSHPLTRARNTSTVPHSELIHTRQARQRRATKNTT